MTLEVFINLLSTVGFPIACAIALAVFTWKIITMTIDNQKEREDKLYNELGECRIINQQAIETIAQYAESIGDIKKDVGVIKHDITVINTKLDSKTISNN